MDDYKIVELYWARSEIAISETSNRYSKYCHQISYNILNSHEDAEECVNDTYLHAWYSIPPHRPSRLSTFLGKITRNLSLDLYRKYNADKRGAGQTVLVLDELEECISSSSGVESAIEEQELTNVLNEFLYSLSKLERSVFVSRYWHVETIADIAIASHSSESRIKSMLLRLRKKLRKYLQKEGVFIG